MTPLIERLEGLTGPCRETDADIWTLAEPELVKGLLKGVRAQKPYGDGELNSDLACVSYLRRHAPAYTSSLDAKLPNEDIQEMSRTFSHGYRCWQEFDNTRLRVCGQHPTSEAIARRIAALRAMEATNAQI